MQSLSTAEQCACDRVYVAEKVSKKELVSEESAKREALVLPLNPVSGPVAEVDISTKRNGRAKKRRLKALTGESGGRGTYTSIFPHRTPH